MVVLLHDHFYHRLDANLAMIEGGVTAKVLVFAADVAIYNPTDEDDLDHYQRTLDQVEGWAIEALTLFEQARALLETRPDRFACVTSAEEILRAKKEGRSAILFGMEGCKAFEGRIELLEIFYRLGLRQAQLTWTRPNQLVEPTWRLSGFGREVVDRMNELGIVIDLAHAPWSLFEEIVERSRHPVIVSHGGPAEPHPGSGDMTRDHLDALRSSGGLLGLHFCRHYINGLFATLEDFLDTIEFLVENGYEEIVALGGDLFEDDRYFRRRHPPPGGAPHEEWRPFIDELSDVRGIPNITRGLLARGFSESTIRSILGENALRVFRTVFGG